MLDDAKLIDIIEPVVSAAGFTLYDAEFRGASLLVMVDGPHGINLDQVASISRTISRHLDEDDPIPGKYTLEVSTPGLERRLRRSDHFLGAIGESVKVKLNPGTAGERRADGELIAADETSATIRTATGDERTVALADIDRARTHFEWGPAPKPGNGSKPGKGSKPGQQKASAKKAQPGADVNESQTETPNNPGESTPTDRGQSQP